MSNNDQHRRRKRGRKGKERGEGEARREEAAGGGGYVGEGYVSETANGANHPSRKSLFTRLTQWPLYGGTHDPRVAR